MGIKGGMDQQTLLGWSHKVARAAPKKRRLEDSESKGGV